MIAMRSMVIDAPSNSRRRTQETSSVPEPDRRHSYFYPGSMAAMSAESIEFTNSVLNAYVENGILFGKTGSCLGKQSPVWENRVLFGKTESCLGKQSPVWENRVLFGKTQSRVWENRVMA